MSSKKPKRSRSSNSRTNAASLTVSKMWITQIANPETATEPVTITSDIKVEEDEPHFQHTKRSGKSHKPSRKSDLQPVEDPEGFRFAARYMPMPFTVAGGNSSPEKFAVPKSLDPLSVVSKMDKLQHAVSNDSSSNMNTEEAIGCVATAQSTEDLTPETSAEADTDTSTLEAVLTTSDINIAEDASSEDSQRCKVCKKRGKKGCEGPYCLQHCYENLKHCEVHAKGRQQLSDEEKYLFNPRPKYKLVKGSFVEELFDDFNQTVTIWCMRDFFRLKTQWKECVQKHDRRERFKMLEKRRTGEVEHPRKRRRMHFGRDEMNDAEQM